MKEKITAIALKKINRNRIYKLIYDQKGIARQEITKGLGLSLPTVNQNLNELEEEGFIHYEGNFKSTGGRKAQVIVINNMIKVTIGLEIRKSYIRIVAIDLYGTVLDNKKYSKPFSTDEKYNKEIGRLIEDMIERNQFPRENILGVGLAVPGVITPNMECIKKSPSLHLFDYPVSNLTSFISYPYIIDNDANAGAFTELWNHFQGESKVYLLVEKGVGGCLIRKDGVIKGSHFHAGEFGHMTLYPGGELCNCGQHGCLEAYISISRISEDLNCQIEDFFTELANGNETYQKVWDVYLENLCIGINNLYMIYDEDIILGGILNQFIEPYLEHIRKHLSKLNLYEKSGDYLKLTNYESRSTAVGVALELVGKFVNEI